MAVNSKQKGNRREREVVNILKKAGVPAKRISALEPGGEDKGDMLVADVWKAQVKGGNHVPKFIYDAVHEDEVMLFMKRDRQPWKICMDLDFFLSKFL